MAQKRMFSLSIIDTDRFLDMSASAQALYFHLGMHGDDDGFVSAPRKIARAVISKNFVIPFESGVVVITDWNINNTLKNDRYRETVYLQEKSKLCLDSNGRYAVGTNLDPTWNQSGTNLEPQPNVTKPNVTERADKPPRSRFSPPTVEQVRTYCEERGNGIDAAAFVDFYTARGWMLNKTKMKDWRAALRTWERRERTKEADPYEDVV